MAQVVIGCPFRPQGRDVPFAGEPDFPVHNSFFLPSWRLQPVVCPFILQTTGIPMPLSRSFLLLAMPSDCHAAASSPPPEMRGISIAYRFGMRIVENIIHYGKASG
jgi:hypothetical protein